MRTMCSCGRTEAEAGCDLCAYCRQDHERAQQEREDEEREMPDEDWHL